MYTDVLSKFIICIILEWPIVVSSCVNSPKRRYSNILK